ncbi:aldo/keto reductase [Terriglobus roseus]|uniref:Aldo/keto reductase family protein n=1 Tax=Terriglobus roseus TaxID=392734 RepID=A0A1G7HRZ0_9BACT|nr:aldo/keto reductase [Terriglobus roseus]SDF03103.1 Aldo/keto reductase family protein [Terriglobus roseus]
MVDTIQLADTGRRTTRLGFGGSSLMGSMDRRQSLRTLEWAFDAGIRHFDVAPMYGYGEAEACLGEFLSRHPGEVTVATKFGIPPAKHPGMIGTARRLVTPLVKAIPGLKKRAQRVAKSVAGPREPRDLSPQKAAASLEKSLRDLRVERIDLFLLHDATAEEVHSAALLEFLQTAKTAGKIGAFGIGTDRAHVEAIQNESPGYAQVIQCEWSVFDPTRSDAAFRIHHRSLGDNFRCLQQWLSVSPLRMKEWSTEVNQDLSDGGILSELMMRAALQMNPSGLLLFSSKNQKHISENAAFAAPSPRDKAARKLYEKVQQATDSIHAECDA